MTAVRQRSPSQPIHHCATTRPSASALSPQPSGLTASAKSICESVAAAPKAHAPAAAEPSSGPPKAIIASSYAEGGSPFIEITAPMKGTNTIGEKGMPYRIMARAWPVSWTNIKLTIPTA